MISRVIFILIITASAINCQKDIQRSRSLQQDKTYRLIIFWGPSKIETDSMKNDEELEVYSDYYYYIGQAATVLRESGIELKDTTSQILNIGYGDHKTESFHRERNSISYIFTDGIQKPKIIRIVMTDTDLISEAKKYFNLK